MAVRRVSGPTAKYEAGAGWTRATVRAALFLARRYRGSLMIPAQRLRFGVRPGFEVAVELVVHATA